MKHFFVCLTASGLAGLLVCLLLAVWGNALYQAKVIVQSGPSIVLHVMLAISLTNMLLGLVGFLALDVRRIK